MDIALKWNTNLDWEGDLVLEHVDLLKDNGLSTAILISLYTDRRANTSDRLPDSSSIDKRGWWGDLLDPPVVDDRIGSRLWLLEREQDIIRVLSLAKIYAEEALHWLVEDGIASSVKVTATEGVPMEDKTINAHRLAFQLEIIKATGEVLTYSAEWEAQLSGI